MYMLPCTSDIAVFGKPERRCRPSQFWETTCRTMPCWYSADRAMCVSVGSAADKSWCLKLQEKSHYHNCSSTSNSIAFTLNTSLGCSKTFQYYFQRIHKDLSMTEIKLQNNPYIEIYIHFSVTEKIKQRLQLLLQIK